MTPKTNDWSIKLCGSTQSRAFASPDLGIYISVYKSGSIQYENISPSRIYVHLAFPIPIPTNPWFHVTIPQRPPPVCADFTAPAQLVPYHCQVLVVYCQPPAKARVSRKEKLTAHTTDVMATTTEVASATATACSSDTRGVAAAFVPL